MKFYNRNNELETLERILVQSKEESRMQISLRGLSLEDM